MVQYLGKTWQLLLSASAEMAITHNTATMMNNKHSNGETQTQMCN